MLLISVLGDSKQLVITYSIRIIGYKYYYNKLFNHFNYSIYYGFHVVSFIVINFFSLKFNYT